MKSCPQCHTKYTDETLQFCLQDGVLLIDEVGQASPDETVAFNDPETETIISRNRPERITVDLSDSSQRIKEEDQTIISSFQPKPKSSRVLIAVLLTVVVMSLTFGFIAVGAYFYFNYQKSEVANDSNVSNSPDQKDQNSNSEAPPGSNVVFDSPTPIKTPKPTSTPDAKNSPTPTPTRAPTPIENPAMLRKRVAGRVHRWKTLAEYRNLNSYMSLYADKIDYYTKRGVSKSFVRRDKRRAFSKYTSIRIRLTNMRIRMFENGNKAVAAFDKQWNFTNNRQSSSGKVRSQLVLIRKGGNWFIRSERDLKVYYVNR